MNQDRVKNPISHAADGWFPQEVVEANVIRGESLIKAWREHKGLTQAEVARRAGMRQPGYAGIEKPGARPRTATLRKIAKALDLSLEQLTD